MPAIFELAWPFTAHSMSAPAGRMNDAAPAMLVPLAA
jgi:hypothetical protein